MSHVVKLAIEVKDLDALEEAATMLGCELVRGATSHLYYAGNRAQCQHAIRVKGKPGAYEIGLVRDGDCWELKADFYNGGKGLEAAVGHNAAKLKQEYAAQVAIKQARRQGMRVHRTVRENGTIVLQAAR